MGIVILKRSQHKPQPGTSWVEVYKPIAGWKAIVYYSASENVAEVYEVPLGFVDVWQTGFLAFDTEEQAIVDAKIWAESEELPLVVRDKLYDLVSK